jgi:hypothetical protein
LSTDEMHDFSAAAGVLKVGVTMLKRGISVYWRPRESLRRTLTGNSIIRPIRQVEDL